MEGGGAMEGRGSGLEDWRGEAHLGSSLPVSARRHPCPLVVSRVHVSWPVSARRSPRPCVVPRVCMSFPMSARHCPCPCVVARVCMCCLWSARRSLCPFTFVGGRFRSWVWVVAFVCGRCLCSGAVRLCSWATARCGGREPLVGGGESSGLV